MFITSHVKEAVLFFLITILPFLFDAQTYQIASLIHTISLQPDNLALALIKHLVYMGKFFQFCLDAI